MTNFPEKRLQIFVSSTFIDLKEERQAAVEAILEAGHIPAGMELFASGDESQMKVIRDWIDESDVFLLILASRYESLYKSKSYIQLEYEYAIEKKKPFIVCVIRSDIEEERRRQKGLEFSEQNHPKKLKQFRKSVCANSVFKFWKNKDEIKNMIQHALFDFSKRKGLTGWIKGTAIPGLFFSRT